MNRRRTTGCRWPAVPFFADRQLANEIQVIESDDVQNAVEKAYKGKLNVGSVKATTETEDSNTERLVRLEGFRGIPKDFGRIFAHSWLTSNNLDLKSLPPLS